MGPGQKPFSWSEFPSTVNNSHVGQADVFDFAFDAIAPAWPKW